MPTQPGSTSKAGIATSSTGERHIPASVRADGSVRKEIRIRPGYRPPEDIEVYKNRTAEAFRNRGAGGVPGADNLASKPTPPSASASASKNAKRRENRKKAAAAGTTEESSNIQSEDTKPAEATEEAQPADPEAEKAKEARKLAKKLRQARELKDRKDKGEGLLPEQFEKVIRINELIRQLDSLGFDANGEKKTDGANS
jgi:partner of Y14 and mago